MTKTVSTPVKPFKEEKTVVSTKKSAVVAKESPAVQKKRDDSNAILIHTLNIIPHIIFVIVNIVKDKKYAIIPTVSFIKNFIDNNYETIKNNTNNPNLLEKSKKFVTKFSEVFLIAYSKTALIDKGLIMLAFVDIVSNEIPNILKQANSIKFVEPSKIFTKILLNAKEIDREYNSVKN
jgi:hypothetical protein